MNNGMDAKRKKYLLYGVIGLGTAAGLVGLYFLAQKKKPRPFNTIDPADAFSPVNQLIQNNSAAHQAQIDLINKLKSH